VDQIETASGAVPESVLKMILWTSPDTVVKNCSALSKLVNQLI